MKKLFAWCFFCILVIQNAQAKSTVSTTLVISQIYGDGGTSGSSYANDFIEIYNAGSAAINLSSYSVQYASGTTWTMTVLTAVVLQPGGYYLIREASNGSGGLPLPASDVTGTISLHSNSGKVALVNSTSVLPNGCLSALIVDLVGYGNATCYEGTAAAAGSNTVSIIRKQGNIDTDNNSTDFTTGTPNARSSSFTLPISISSFSVNKNGKNNDLRWQLNCTAAAITFELQRCSNGLNFESIYAESATRARCSMPFIFTDRKPLGINYYRLKITDADKNTSYSKIVLMVNTVSIREGLKLNPTVVGAQGTLKYFSPVSENIQWVISDMEGKVIKKIGGSVTSGENNILLKTSYLSSGQYQLRGYTIHGTTVAIKFIKE
ncbi:MAG: hypothetical protein JWN83_826 [Chitinophagaceae bacterium]|nr:hypothetical protein [Chitinophagaceae bacterium]